MVDHGKHRHWGLPATRRGVTIPGLSAAQVDHGPSQSEAMEASASAKLAELSAVLESNHLDEPDLDSLYFQTVAEEPSEDELGEQEDAAVQSPAAGSGSAEEPYIFHAM